MRTRVRIADHVRVGPVVTDEDDRGRCADPRVHRGQQPADLRVQGLRLRLHVLARSCLDVRFGARQTRLVLEGRGRQVEREMGVILGEPEEPRTVALPIDQSRA